MEGKNENMPHKLTFENRTSGTITGVRDVTSFDEKEILLLTTQGKLKLKGEQMHVKRLGLPEDIANAAAFLASEDSGWITGQAIHVNGGILTP